MGENFEARVSREMYCREARVMEDMVWVVWWRRWKEVALVERSADGLSVAWWTAGGLLRDVSWWSVLSMGF